MILADIDGVYVGLDGKVSSQALGLSVNYCARRLQMLAFVTGREWVHVNKEFAPRVSRILDVSEDAPPCAIGCEYSTRIFTHTSQGWQKKPGRQFEAPEEYVTDLASGIALKFDRLIFHADKEVILTVGIPSGADWNNEVAREQLEAAVPLMAAIAREHNLVLHRTTKAIDLVPAGISKAYGGEVILDWCESPPAHVHVLGDAIADLMLADPCIERSIPYTLWYVGKQEDVTADHRHKYNLQFPPSGALYVDGTIEILKTLQ